MTVVVVDQRDGFRVGSDRVFYGNPSGHTMGDKFLNLPSTPIYVWAVGRPFELFQREFFNEPPCNRLYLLQKAEVPVLPDQELVFADLRREVACSVEIPDDRTVATARPEDWRTIHAPLWATGSYAEPVHEHMNIHQRSMTSAIGLVHTLWARGDVLPDVFCRSMYSEEDS